ncbi:hypothetical protein GCM10025777_25910 [Membranihabitans marinus]
MVIELKSLTPIQFQGDTMAFASGFILYFQNPELSASLNLECDLNIGLLNIENTEIWTLPIEVQSLELEKTTSLQLLSNPSVTIASTLNSTITSHWAKIKVVIKEQINLKIKEELTKVMIPDSLPKVMNWRWEDHSEGVKILTFNYINPEASPLNTTTIAANIKTEELLKRISDIGLPSFHIQNTVILLKQIHVIDENRISIDIETEDGKIQLCAYIKLYLTGKHIYQKVEDIQWIEGGFIQKTLFRMLRELIINKIESRHLDLVDAWTTAQNKLKPQYPFIDLTNPHLSEISTLKIGKQVTTIHCSFIA